MHKKVNLFKAILCLFIFSASSPSFSNDYLEELEAEAESSSHIADKNSPATKKVLSDEESKARLIADNNEKEFKTILKNEFPATYNAYKKLSYENKTKVVNLYLDGGKDVSAATHLLFNLYFKTKKEQRANNATN